MTTGTTELTLQQLIDNGTFDGNLQSSTECFKVLRKYIEQCTDLNGVMNSNEVLEAVKKDIPNFLFKYRIGGYDAAGQRGYFGYTVSEHWENLRKNAINYVAKRMGYYRPDGIGSTVYIKTVLDDVLDQEPDSDEAYDRAEIMEEHEAKWTPEDQSRYEMFQLVMKTFRKAGIKLDIDHAKSLKEGGQHHPDNMQLLLEADNRAKGAGSCPRYMWETQKAELVSHINRAGRLNRFNSDTTKQLNLMIRLLSTVYHGF